MPRHHDIFPGDTPSRHELERQLSAVKHDLREERDYSDRLEIAIETRSELVRGYLEEQETRAKAKADTLFHMNPPPDSDEWVELQRAIALEKFIKRTIRALKPAMRSRAE